MLKLILVNIRNTFILLALAYFTIPVISAAWLAWAPEQIDERALVPNYAGADWARQHFREIQEQKTTFLGFVGWRRLPYAGRTINVDTEQRRVTPPITELSNTAPTYFFGGSTMWGEGSPDAMTIPAFYQSLSHEPAVNYGESAWGAHQSVNQLMQLITAGHRAATVIFYDGINEVANKCRRENNFYSYYNERSIRTALELLPTDFEYYWRPVKVASKEVAQRIFGDEIQDGRKFYDCDTESKKADLVAEALLEDWTTAKYVAESHGARFFAFLQPVSFLSKTRLSHLKLGEPKLVDLGKQYEAVYPLIRAKMKQRGIGIVLSSILDRDEYFYVDQFHVSPNANQIIAESIRKSTATLALSSGR